jgi:DNA-binding transcriptional ArsR family regulator
MTKNKSRRVPPVPAAECTSDEHARRAAPKHAPSLRMLATAAHMLEAAGNPQRLALLVLLRQGPRSVAEIAEAVDREPSLVSQHLAILRAARLVRGVRQGKFVFYEFFDAHARQFIDAAVAHAGRIGGASTRS